MVAAGISVALREMIVRAFGLLAIKFRESLQGELGHIWNPGIVFQEVIGIGYLEYEGKGFRTFFFSLQLKGEGWGEVHVTRNSLHFSGGVMFMYSAEGLKSWLKCFFESLL